MHGREQYAEHGCESRRERRAEHPHIAWKHEHVIERDIQKTAAEHGDHGEIGIFVVADKTQHHVIDHERGRKFEKSAQIVGGHVQNFAARAERVGNRTCEKQPAQQV